MTSQEGGTRLPEFEAILRSVDHNQPMDGESSVAAASLDEARLWTSVYREVVAMETSVLNSITQQLSSLSPHARQEAETTNVPLIRGQLERFRHRLALWEARQAELSEPPG